MVFNLTKFCVFSLILSFLIACSPAGNAEIYIYDLVEGVSTQLTTNEDYDHMPVWLPDGSGIMFTSYSSGTEKIYILDLETMETSLFNTGIDQ